MATGGELRQSIDCSSDIVYDFSCTPCGSDGGNIDALFYCVDCVERFCSTCLRNHNRYAIMKAHTILDKADMVAIGPQPAYCLPTERCSYHHSNLIDTYCPEHRDVCCPTCVSIDHRSCKGITYIPIAAKNITESEEYTDIKPSILKIQERLEKMKKTMYGDLEKLHIHKADALKQIADFRKIIDSELDRMEQYVIDDLQSRHTVIETDIKSNIKSLENLISTLESSLQKLEKLNDNNESEIFVQLKLGEKRKCDGESLLQKMEINSARETLTFTKNEELSDFMSYIDNIGKLTDSNESSLIPKSVIKSDDINQKTPQVQRASPENKNQKTAHIQQATSIDKTDVKDQKTIHIQQRKPSVKSDSATFCGEYIVKLSNDKSTCDIYDCCQLQDGTYIISDFNNNTIKKLNSSFQVINSYLMTSRPSGVCVAGTMEVAVTLDEEQKVQFVSVGDILQPTRSFTTDMNCSGCAYNNNYCLLVSSRSKVAMFSKTGQLLKENKLSLMSSLSLSVYTCVICNKNNTNIYFTNLANKVVVLNKKGEKIATIKDLELKGAANVCVLDNDDILVCCQGSNKVIRFSRYGRKLGVVLQKSDGLKKTQSICWDRINSRLIVTNENSDKIKVYILR